MKQESPNESGGSVNVTSEAVYSAIKMLKKTPKFILILASSLLPFIFSIENADAFLAKVGVVKSLDNAQQWSGITNRLKASGVDYCIVDANNWQDVSNLKSIRVLILPNVATINGLQANLLKTWMGEGGRVIVTGPTGSLSDVRIRTELKSLFGAYWGFGNTTATTLRLVNNSAIKGANPTSLSDTFIGGVVIPTAVNSQPAAVWASEGFPPAVVVNDKTVFLGWRWGVDGVASVNLDTAWLTTILESYGISREQQIKVMGAPVAPPCPGMLPKQMPTPILPNLNDQSLKPSGNTSEKEKQPRAKTPGQNSVLLANLAEQNFSLPLESNNGSVLSPKQVTAMSQELENLIGRFASTLLAAEATNSGINSPTKQGIEQSFNNSSPKHPESPGKPSNRQSYQALQEAREGLRQFHQLVERQEYSQARRLWLQARRNLWDNYPTDRQFAQPEIRGMWLDRGTIVQAKSEADLAVIFDSMAEAGINTVFLETVNSSYTIYPSRIAPEQNPLTRGWDPLKVAVKLAHERGMELHAWVWIFAANNQRHNEIIGQPRDYLGPVLSRNPDWGMTDKDGNYFDRGVQYRKAFFDPANPQVQQYLLSLLDEIATNYDVDGIQFDYIRYPFQDPKIDETFGYSKSSRWLFKEMTGVDPLEISPSHNLWSQWTGFRIRQVDNFVATASARLKEKHPHLILSAAVFPIERRERLFRLQQNWEEWVRQSQIDMIVLMTYALDTGNFEERTQPLSDKSLIGASLIIPGLRLLKVPDSVTIDQLQLVRNMPTGGFALFAAENLTSNLQGIFNRTQRSNVPIKLEPLPYRQPFKAASARFQALQQEWSFLLTNNHLVMDEKTMREWGRQVDILGAALQQLGDRPSEQNYNTAKASLTQFHRQFTNVMRQQKKATPYQVEVWENRLEVLDKLLVYGDRIILKERRNRVAER